MKTQFEKFRNENLFERAKKPALRFGFAAALVFVLLFSGIAYGKDSFAAGLGGMTELTAEIRKAPAELFKEFFSWLGESVISIPGKIGEGIKEIPQIITQPFKKETPPEIVSPPPAAEETAKKEIYPELAEQVEGLRAEIKRLQEQGLPQKETIKEVSKITQIEPIKEITKETIRIDEKETSWLKEKVSQFSQIAQKLQANPQNTSAPTSPIYIGSQGIQVGGAGTFSSLGVSGSAGFKDLGVGDSATLGENSSDKLTVNSTASFVSPVSISGALTTTGAFNASNLSVSGIISASLLTLSTSSSSSILSVTQSGTGNIVEFFDSATATAAFVVTSAGLVGIGAASPTEKLEIAGNIKPATSTSYNLGTWSMDTIPDVTMTGEAAYNTFGDNVASAGDVNGDGYQDVLVAAPGYSGISRAYIYYGGSSMDNVADVTMTGETVNDRFGSESVSSAGDVNGDGYMDVIIGAYGWSSLTGRAYIFYGGANMDNTADIIFTGAGGERLGYGVSSAGDVNGDGYQDVIVGAPHYNSNTGRAYIFYGGSSMDNVADVTLTGAAGDLFGDGVASADINGDGYTDVIVGADGVGGNTGRAYIFFGGPNMDNTADVTMTGEAAGDGFGLSVASAGDVNGDGYTDVLVPSPYNNAAGTDAGRAYIFFGGTSMDSTADVTLTAEAAGDQFGEGRVSSVGDVNGDGYQDVIVGAATNDAGGSNAGRAYIYYGGTSMDNTADIIFTGEAANYYLGYGIAPAGDVNGDGYQDVIIGAYGYSGQTGRAYIYQGSGSRWQSVFTQSINLKRGLQIGNLYLDKRGLLTSSIFGITTSNWEIDNRGTASFQNLIVADSLGIGTTNPIEKLDISGNLRLGQAPLTYATTTETIGSASTTIPVTSTTNYPLSGTLLIDSEAMAYTGTNATSFTGVTRAVLGTATSTHATSTQVKNYIFTALASSTTPRMVITGDGNVGIGITAPGRNLDVSGNASISNNLLTQIEGGLYYGRVNVREQQWAITNVGVNWTARETNRSWYGVAMSSDGKYQTAVDGTPGQIYTSSDYGITWTARDSSRNWWGVAISSDGKYQTAVVSMGQIYTSSDYGITWTARESNRVWSNIAMSSDAKYQTAVVWGGQIYTSSDYGLTWTARESNRVWSNIAMSSDGKYQTAVVSMGQIYTSSDYGLTWTARESNRDWMGIAMSSDAKYQTAVVEDSTNGQIYTSSDYGLTWTARESNRDWENVAMSSDGKYQTAVDVGPGQIYISSDYGITWTARESNRVWYDVAMSSDGKYQTAVVDGGQIYTSYADSYIYGSIGIGTSNPIERLDVSGNIRFGSSPLTYTTTTQAIGSASTTIPVASTTGYLSSGTLLIDSEAITYATTTATSFGGLTRGALGTAASTHSSGATVKNYIFTGLASSTLPRMVVTGDGSLGLGTTNPGGGTGSSILSLYNSSATPTAQANTTHLYSSSGEGYWMDAAGNLTLQTPHDSLTGEWIFRSENVSTGKVLRVEMEKLVKFVNRYFGLNLVEEYCGQSENTECIANLTVQENDSGQIVELSPEQLKTGLAGLGLTLNEQGTLEVRELKAKKVIAEQFEMTDKATGEPYCAWIENGEWQKVKGECGAIEEPPACQPADEICDGVDNNCDGQIDEGGVCPEGEQAPYGVGETAAPPAGDVCDTTHLNLCTTQTECETAGGSWYNDTCNG